LVGIVISLTEFLFYNKVIAELGSLNRGIGKFEVCLLESEMGSKLL